MQHNFTTYYYLIVKKFEEDGQTIQTLHAENDSLLEKFRIHEENIKTLYDSNEQVIKERDEVHSYSFKFILKSIFCRLNADWKHWMDNTKLHLPKLNNPIG